MLGVAMMDRADINSVLMQMRAIRAQMEGPQIMQPPVPMRTEGVNPLRPDTVNPADRVGFGDVLKGAVDNVNTQQMQASKLRTAYELGDSTVDLPEVMISAQKASVSFEAMLKVRNRLVTAYEDIIKMPM